LFVALEKSLGRLPIVAEDLGVITPEVEALRKKHGIPGMVVLQFAVDDPEFDYGAIEENSVCYTGTHDNDTTAGWFDGKGDDTRTVEELERTRTRTLELTGGAANTIHWDMTRLAFGSRATIAVAPMQDVLGLGSAARLNRPGSTLNNWRWRMQAEELRPEVAEAVARMVEATSRTPVKGLDSAA
jgi:4-alpha-glucanotransferase